MPWLVLSGLPMAYLVWWKRSLMIGVAFHLLVNAVGVLISIPNFFGP